MGQNESPLDNGLSSGPLKGLLIHNLWPLRCNYHVLNCGRLLFHWLTLIMYGFLKGGVLGYLESGIP